MDTMEMNFKGLEMQKNETTNGQRVDMIEKRVDKEKIRRSR